MVGKTSRVERNKLYNESISFYMSTYQMAKQNCFEIGWILLETSPKLCI